MAAAVLTGCGGQGGSSEGDGSSGDQVLWPDRGGGTSSALPAVVQTGRIVFESQTGESCCVAIDPVLLSGDAAAGLAILDDLPTGPATVTVAGYATEFAPAAPGIADTCTTVRPATAAPCDPARVAAAAFESEPLPVTIVAGVQTDLSEVPMRPLPFLLDVSPPQDEETAVPVAFGFTIVDAVTDVRRDSVALEVAFEVEAEAIAADAVALQVSGQPSFRLVTKRIPIQLSACADGSDSPCSADGGLDLAGFRATGQALALPAGAIEAHITGENFADPPLALDFRYSFSVVTTP